MLRALRFASRLDFSIAGGTWRAIRQHATKIKRISAERVLLELEYILVDPHRGRGMQLAGESGLLKEIFHSVKEEDLLLGIEAVSHLPRRSSFALALATFLTFCDINIVGLICRELKASNELRRQVQWLVCQRGVLLERIPLSRGRLKRWLAEPLFESLMQLNRCYLRAAGRGESKLRKLRGQIRELGDEPISPARLLDGHELIRLGAKPGPMVGQLIEELYLAQLENQVRTKAQAHTWVRQWIERHQENG